MEGKNKTQNKQKSTTTTPLYSPNRWIAFCEACCGSENILLRGQSTQHHLSVTLKTEKRVRQSKGQIQQVIIKARQRYRSMARQTRE